MDNRKFFNEMAEKWDETVYKKWNRCEVLWDTNDSYLNCKFNTFKSNLLQELCC